MSHKTNVDNLNTLVELYCEMRGLDEKEYAAGLDAANLPDNVIKISIAQHEKWMTAYMHDNWKI